MEYEEKTVKILDAQVSQDLGDENSPKFAQHLVLLLQDIESNFVFKSILSEEDIRIITKMNTVMSSKQMIDFATKLREREEPIKMLVPPSGDENISAEDIIQTRKFDNTKPKRKRRRRKHKPTAVKNV